MKKKFSAAFNGLYLAFMHRSCRIQFIFGFLAVVCGLALALTFGEWLAFILCIGLVITMEIMNTAIEKLCDLVDNKYNPKIKIIKDLSAAAVLTAAIMSLIIASFIIYRHLF